ncbi:hypothetical protein DO97_16875 [Neosynechococcus sphagnicola sy1]|uniref:Uncharacterized protein n=1 Tax=Neosynechococcus sphagnicola sy1 TaxID=1497020 RepID=A0A098TSB1_9CYAN|nr:hypothetical protein DO97_16875 [Neosynechococcus sphagnicola sy1]
MITGANHFSYGEHEAMEMSIQLGLVAQNHLAKSGDIFGNWKQSKRFQQYVHSTTIIFWDSYLKQNNCAQIILNSDALLEFSHGEISIFRK